MIFGGGKILFIFCALIFALQFSTSNAYYLNNHDYNNGTVPENYMVDNECDECVRYKCKLNENGEIIEGKDCLKNVVKFCGISKLDESMLNSVVQETAYEYKSETYFISSCQDNKDVNDEKKDQMNVKMDQRREKRYDNDEKYCDEYPIAFSENDKVSDRKEYVKNRTKCFFEFLEHISSVHIPEALNALTNVKMAAKDILKAVNYAKKANEIMKDGDYFKKKADEIGQKAENVSTIISDVDKMLKDLERILFTVEKKCAELNETLKACLNETVNCTLGQFYGASQSCEMPIYENNHVSKMIVKIAKEFMETINEIKPEAEKVFMEANVFLTAQNAQELAEEATKIGESAKKDAKESKEIGENSNKTANFAVEIGMEAKMAANESMKIGNEANQKALEVEKLAKDSMKLAETNQKAGDKTVAEVQKLKSSGEQNRSKIGIFGILLFAYTSLY